MIKAAPQTRMSAAEYRATAKAKKPSAHRIIATPLDGEPVRYGRLSLNMPPLSVNNLFANGGKGNGRFATGLYKSWQAMALIQLRRQGGWHVPGGVRIRLQFTREQTKADLDNLAKPVLDVLVKAGRIADDRNVSELRLLFSTHVTGTQIDIWTSALAMDDLPKKGRAPLIVGGETPDAVCFREQIPTSTDPAYLERMALVAEEAASREAEAPAPAAHSKSSARPT